MSAPLEIPQRTEGVLAFLVLLAVAATVVGAGIQAPTGPEAPMITTHSVRWEALPEVVEPVEIDGYPVPDAPLEPTE